MGSGQVEDRTDRDTARHIDTRWRGQIGFDAGTAGHAPPLALTDDRRFGILMLHEINANTRC